MRMKFYKANIKIISQILNWNSSEMWVLKIGFRNIMDRYELGIRYK